MHAPRFLSWALTVLSAVCAVTSTVASAQTTQAPRLAAGKAEQARVIVMYRDDATLLRTHSLRGAANLQEVNTRVQRRADSLARSARVALRAGRAVSERMHVVTASGISSAELAKRLASDPEVASAEVDGRKRARVAPNDPLYSTPPAVNLTALTGGPAAGQWYLRAPTSELRSAVNAEAAWARSTGQGVVVAVLDTGVLRSHLDLDTNILAGYDFINDAATANDGSARDNDASDPGDFLTLAEVNDSSSEFFGGSPNFCSEFDISQSRYRAVDSSWHGTKVSGIIAAKTNNGQGGAGVAHGARILPVRVLGKCGGFDSDIQAGMRWAAGLEVPGVPSNANPAKVLNMSLGSEGTCSGSYRSALADVTTLGAVVVAAAGNSSGHAVGTPANCPGVIAVAGLRHAGTKVGFSDLGPEITIAAPGGNCVNTSANSPCLYPIVTTTNAGTTTALAGSSVYSDAFKYTVGTSFATPIVSGTVALMLSAQPGLTPAEVKSLIQATARAFPTSGANNGPSDATPVLQCTAPNGTDQLQCYCSTALCGAGMLDTSAATSAAAQALLARIGVSPAEPLVGNTVTLSASPTLVGPGRTITRWQWALVDGGGVITDLSGAKDAATVTLNPTSAGTITVRLTVTDDQGRSASVDSSFSIAATAVVNPPSEGASSSGGSLSPFWLLALALATGWLSGVSTAGVRRTRRVERAGSGQAHETRRGPPVRD